MLRTLWIFGKHWNACLLLSIVNRDVRRRK